jgi:hypothetical protein
LDRNGSGERQVGRPESRFQSDIDHHDFARPGTVEQPSPVHGLRPGWIGGHPFQRPAQFQQVRFRHLAHRHPQASDILACEPAGPVPALASPGHQTSLPEHVQVRAGQVDVDPQPVGQTLHRSLSLRQKVQQFKAPVAGAGLAGASDLFVEKLFGVAGYHSNNPKNFLLNFKEGSLDRGFHSWRRTGARLPFEFPLRING